MRGQDLEGSIADKQYRIIATLYSRDGKRCAEVCKFRGGKTYLRESEWVERKNYAPGHDGKLIGPFERAVAAEWLIIGTDWFCGRT